MFPEPLHYIFSDFCTHFLSCISTYRLSVVRSHILFRLVVTDLLKNASFFYVILYLSMSSYYLGSHIYSTLFEFQCYLHSNLLYYQCFTHHLKTIGFLSTAYYYFMSHTGRINFVFYRINYIARDYNLFITATLLL